MTRSPNPSPGSTGMDAKKSEFPVNHRNGPAPGTLRSITSHETGRYDTSILVEPRPKRIPAGLFTVSQDPECAKYVIVPLFNRLLALRPEYLPPLWSAQVHPEGQLYFYRDGPLRVVTEAYLYRTETHKNMCFWIDRIQEILASTETAVSRDIELFIKLEGDNCAYYFVDHATRTQFWLECSSTEELGLPPVISISQLKIVLEELYWIHVEHFPMHLEALSPQTLDEIIGIFSHGLCGNMANGHTTWIIDHNKYITHYGQEHSRLSRDQAILFDPEQKHDWISTIMAALTLKTSDRHLARLDDVLVDHIVYVDQWERFMSDCLREWKRSAYGALSGLVLHLPFLVLNVPCTALLTASVAIFGSGLFSSIVLAHQYEPMQGITATEAMYYLENVQSPVFRFQPLAFVFSLPQTFHLWGSFVFLVNCVLLVSEYLGWEAAVGLSGMTMLLVLSLYCATSEAFHTWSGKLIRGFHRTCGDTGAHMV
ncbi:hypothetical protein B0H17DRAFT_1185971 [Mycena rosella]|uniref:Uncharacterized protein n=1 Tax=Mycena rosella TaxID=1033263 RepID=A0AAD7CP81_MYCRO|nr:hypothetical protein B0H17DRAFT_1185971 [Mycena rosella]